MLAAHECDAIGELIRMVEPLLREIGRLPDGGEALNARLRNAGVGRSIEPRAGNVELLDEFNILIVRNSRIAELRVADLELEGIPARDLTQDEYVRLTKEQRALVDNGGLYSPAKPARSKG